MSILGVISSTIPANQTTTPAIDLAGNVLQGLITPPALTSTTVTFQVSQDGDNYVPLYLPSGTQVSITVAAGRYIDVGTDSGYHAINWRGVRFVKAVFGSAEARVAGTVILFVSRPQV